MDPSPVFVNKIPYVRQLPPGCNLADRMLKLTDDQLAYDIGSCQSLFRFDRSIGSDYHGFAPEPLHKGIGKVDIVFLAHAAGIENKEVWPVLPDNATSRFMVQAVGRCIYKSDFVA
jgi:hypothetical protein